MSTCQDNHIYAGLGAREIRLLTILPGNWDDLISCKLSEPADLDEKPIYEALSYVWSDPPGSKKKISLDGYTFEVTTNLEAALRHLRQNDVSRVMWIDAICIDQINLKERSSQVILMREIFEQSTQTIVWLGEGTPASRAAFSLMRDFTHENELPDDLWLLPKMWAKLKLARSRKNIFIEIVNRMIISQDIFRAVEILTHDDSLMDKNGIRDARKFRAKLRFTCSHAGINGLFFDVAERAWFRRVWVAQELAVSKNTMVTCGYDSMEWTKFSKLYYAILQELKTINIKRTSIKQNFVEGSMAFLKLFRLSRLPSERDLNISALVANTRLMEASDPRDVVYALLGLASDNPQDDPSSIVPDYDESTTVLQVYKSLVEHSIQKQQSLDIICMRRKYNNLGNWPSWIPEWSTSFGTAGFSPDLATGKSDWVVGTNFLSMPLIDDFRTLSGPKDEEEIFYHWAAAGKTSPACEITGLSPVLHASGILIDEINNLGEPFSFTSDSWRKGDISVWNEVILRNFGDTRESENYSVFHISYECLLLFRAANTIRLRERASIAGITLPWQVYERFQVLSQFWPRMREWKRLQSTYPAKQHKYIEGGSVIEAYTTTLFLDRVFSPRTARREEWDGYEMFRSGEWRRDWSREDILSNDERYSQNLIHRNLIISKKGYIGLGPFPARRGDMICVLFGCSVPVIIRKVEDHHILIAESYVHGLMDGQAIDMLKSGDSAMEKFVLH